MLVEAAGGRKLPAKLLDSEMLAAFQQALDRGGLRIKFYWPIPSASIEISDPPDPDDDATLADEEIVPLPSSTIVQVFSFRVTTKRQFHAYEALRKADRSDETSIGLPTIRAVGRLLAGVPSEAK